MLQGKNIKKRRTDCSREDHGSEKDGLLQGENRIERRTDFFREEQEGGGRTYLSMRILEWGELRKMEGEWKCAGKNGRFQERVEDCRREWKVAGRVEGCRKE